MNIPQLNYVTTFRSKSLHPIDFAYKKALQQGLKDTFQLDCKIKDLSSIAGPVELKQIIKNGFIASFLSDEEKEKAIQSVDLAWQE